MGRIPYAAAPLWVKPAINGRTVHVTATTTVDESHDSLDSHSVTSLFVSSLNIARVLHLPTRLPSQTGSTHCRLVGLSWLEPSVCPATPSPCVWIVLSRLQVFAVASPQWPHPFRTTSISSRLDSSSVCLGWNCWCSPLPPLRDRGHQVHRHRRWTRSVPLLSPAFGVCWESTSLLFYIRCVITTHYTASWLNHFFRCCTLLPPLCLARTSWTLPSLCRHYTTRSRI